MKRFNWDLSKWIILQYGVLSFIMWAVYFWTEYSTTSNNNDILLLAIFVQMVLVLCMVAIIRSDMKWVTRRDN